MTQNSAISWTHDTWNFAQGCTHVSPGCINCYMYREKKRYGQNPADVVRSKPGTFNAPLTKLDGPLVFTCSWSDMFHEDVDSFRDDAWDIIRKTVRPFERRGVTHDPLVYQVLTKRPERIAEHLPPDWGSGWPNVWLGVSVENPDYLWRVYELSHIPCQLRFVSYEPALDYVDFKPFANHIDWVISGGESGPGYRPADPVWFQKVMRDCERAGITFFHKQNGGVKKIDGDWGGNKINGELYQDFPLPEPHYILGVQ